MRVFSMKHVLWMATLVAITVSLAIPANAAEGQGTTDETAELAKKLEKPGVTGHRLPQGAYRRADAC